MKIRLLFTITFGLLLVYGLNAQEVVHPTKVSRAVYFDKIESLKDLPTGAVERDPNFVRNAKLKERSYPFQKRMPGGEDAVWQKTQGTRADIIEILNFAGQSSPYSPSDCNGAIGPNHFFQGVNTTFAVYNKTNGTKVAGPTDYNTLFDGVTGASRNDGDPIILYDEQADRWMAAEFSIQDPPNYMLIAVSETNDPTGAWYRWSFDMNGMPDYMKFGIWQDGYYMGTNTGSGDDIYVFEREAMINGESAPQMVQFDNPNRAGTFDGFSIALPFDNQANFAPAGTPGQFISICDDAQNSGYDDELWLFECKVDWANPDNSTFSRTAQIPVAAFDTNFGSGWDNIAQPGTSQKIDAVPGIMMYTVQYRNWGSSQSLVCTHTVDVDDTDHAGVRWYELENTGSGWGIRQQGTYAPDEHSRFQASIAMNAKHEIAIGYSISSSTEYPGIRVTGQSASENANASGILDMPEMIVKQGAQSQTSGERWGDYSLMSVDPVDDHTFWYTAEYYSSGKKTQIAAFQLSLPKEPTIAATPISTTQINIDYELNDSNEPALIAWSADGTFGTPADGTTYSAGDAIPGGGTVLVYDTNNGTYNHTGLSAKTKYYYKAWSYQTDNTYSNGSITDATTLQEAPTNHVTNFTAGTPTGSSVPLTWTDATGTILPDGYIIKVSNAGFSSITDPVNGTDEANDSDLSDGNGSMKVAFGTEAATFSELLSLTTYYFKIYPYTNNNENILYKTDGTVPEASATTTIEYCNSTFSNTTDDWISNVTFNTINNTTGQDGENSYGDYSDISTEVNASESHQISVTFESGTYNEYVTVWFDWNNNGDFTDSGETYDLGSGASTTLTADILVPDDAHNGTIRMRVTEQYYTAPSPCDPQDQNYGETEDYTIIINNNSSKETNITDSEFNIHPNPTSGIFNIEAGNENIHSIQIYNISGKLVCSETIESNTAAIDLSNQTKGMYFIKINANNKVINAKLIVK